MIPVENLPLFCYSVSGLSWASWLAVESVESRPPLAALESDRCEAMARLTNVMTMRSSYTIHMILKPISIIHVSAYLLWTLFSYTILHSPDLRMYHRPLAALIDDRYRLFVMLSLCCVFHFFSQPGFRLSALRTQW